MMIQVVCTALIGASALATQAAPLMYVVSDDRLSQYQAASGRFQGIVGTQHGATHGSYTGITLGPDGAIYSFGDRGIWRWDVETGTAMLAIPFGQEVTYGPGGFVFGNDGLLYVTSDNSLLRYDPINGHFIGVVGTQIGASAGSYTCITLGPDGAIYSIGDHGIWRWDVETGTAMLAIPFGREVTYGPGGFVFGNDGLLYVTSDNSLLRYDSQSGRFLGIVGTQTGASLGSHTGIAVGLSGDIYSLGDKGLWQWNTHNGSAKLVVRFCPEVTSAPAGFVVAFENGENDHSGSGAQSSK